MYYELHINLFYSENNEDSGRRRLQYHLFFIPTRSLVCESQLKVSRILLYHCYVLLYNTNGHISKVFKLNYFKLKIIES